jgi:hypothetical protein
MLVKKQKKKQKKLTESLEIYFLLDCIEIIKQMSLYNLLKIEDLKKDLKKKHEKCLILVAVVVLTYNES